MGDLHEDLKDWTDLDIAEYLVGRALGLWKEGEPFNGDLKHVFCSINKTGYTLYELLRKLVSLGFLEENEDEDQVRWKACYDSQNELMH